VPAAGVIAGRITPAMTGRWVVIGCYAGSGWVARLETLVGADGRYCVSVRSAGLYRVGYSGATGPAVQLP
jgi:hypothetical protein